MMQRLAGAMSATMLTILYGLTPPAAAATGEVGLVMTPARSSPWAVTFGPSPGSAGVDTMPVTGLTLSAAGLFIAPADGARRQDRGGPATSGEDQGTPRTTAFVYSDGYRVRRKIHFVASFATIPLFVTQYALGKKLYDGTGSSGTRSAHQAVAAGVGVLFGVNTVTGVWNLVEARKDPNKRTARLVHGILMLAADAGFVATAALAPDDDGEGNRSTHRTVALTSVALATTGYLIMLFSR